MKYFIAESTMLQNLPVSETELKEKYIPLHAEHIASGIAAGIVLCAGPKEEGGGIMVARAKSEESFMDFINRDPFTLFGLARFEVKEFMMKDRSSFVMGF